MTQIITKLYKPKSNTYFSSTKGETYKIKDMSYMHLSNAIRRLEKEARVVKRELKDTDPVNYGLVNGLTLPQLATTLCPLYDDLATEYNFRNENKFHSREHMNNEKQLQMSLPLVTKGKVVQTDADSQNLNANHDLVAGLDHIVLAQEYLKEASSRGVGQGILEVISDIDEIVGILEKTFGLEKCCSNSTSRELASLKFSDSVYSNTAFINTLKKRGITTLEQLSTISVLDLCFLHRVGGNLVYGAVGVLKSAGLSFSKVHKYLLTELAWHPNESQPKALTLDRFVSNLENEYDVLDYTDKTTWVSTVDNMIDRIGGRWNRRISSYATPIAFKCASIKDATERVEAINRHVVDIRDITQDTRDAIVSKALKVHAAMSA